MIISKTAIDGPAIIDLEQRSDHRGFFARTFCVEEFSDAGLIASVQQCNLSYNHRAGTLRGMHFQVLPHPEAKLVRCIAGAIVDIIVDLRPDSPTRFEHVAVELSAENRRALYVPPYFAHGYQTLVDGAAVLYQVSGSYAPAAEPALARSGSRPGLTAARHRGQPERRQLRAARRARSPAAGPHARAGGSFTAISAGVPVITQNYRAVVEAEQVDAVVEATGAVEYGCHVVAAAIDHGKHVLLLNAEVDGTVGPILSRRAERNGVVLTGCDGDQPGVQVNLARFVRGIGLRPLVCGNIKGLQDPYRTPQPNAASPNAGVRTRTW